ncbi:hypothetical protein SAMN06273572_105233 [Monaibacterium marinum]|uniref:Bile acid:Na+ symporter, BASS family n=1 Tax=Pontivivens marinum TaxID=1690039 RepID=A0A2C9CU69_9RHOB|nr:hypothetical protein [Monaibacterium marinum]SOH94807.1 hypothetical protein SAMN06273572_105233 [Monaibacterium marinum]
MKFLEVIGANARWVMAGGCVAALFLPSLSALLRPALPALVSVVLAVAMTRIDLGAIARGAIRPARLFSWLAAVVLMMPVSGALLWVIGHLVLPQDRSLLVLYAAAPPIASAAGICFLMRYDAQRAVEVTATATLLTPIIGPLLLALMVPDLPGLDPVPLAIRLSMIIAGGVTLAIAAKAIIGQERIAASGRRFDGIAACIMVLFVIPLFDGVGGTILSDPQTSLRILALCFVLNLGTTIAVLKLGEGPLGRARAGAYGVLSGNRTVAIYLAALPYDPHMALFVALYQFPMYLTPLALDALGLNNRNEAVTSP